MPPGVDLTAEREFLQVRSLRAPAGKTYDAHKHLEQMRSTTLTQEAIIVIQGRVEVRFYDADDQPLCTSELNHGDCVIALTGGHAFTVLDDDTLMYELKNGPYNGLAKDKVRIV